MPKRSKVSGKKTKKRPTKRHPKAKSKSKKLSKVELLQKQVEYLRKKVQRYERQRFSGPIQEGKKRRKAPRAELDKVRLEMKAFMEGVKRNLELNEAHPMAATYRSYENADQSIDAEIRLHLEDSGDIEGALIDLEDSGEWNRLSSFYIMVGIGVTAEEKTGSPSIDKRPQKPWTKPFRGDRAGSAFFTAREKMARHLEEWGASAKMISVRISWSPTNERPKRRGR